MEKFGRQVPCKVKFKYPNNQVKTGWVTRATAVRRHKGGKGEGADYATRVELIEFDDDKDSKHIRFAYWRRLKGKNGKYRWNWASQTTWVFPIGVTRQAIEDAEKAGLFQYYRLHSSLPVSTGRPLFRGLLGLPLLLCSLNDLTLSLRADACSLASLSTLGSI